MRNVKPTKIPNLFASVLFEWCVQASHIIRPIAPIVVKILALNRKCKHCEQCILGKTLHCIDHFSSDNVFFFPECILSDVSACVCTYTLHWHYDPHSIHILHWCLYASSSLEIWSVLVGETLVCIRDLGKTNLSGFAT